VLLDPEGDITDPNNQEIDARYGYIANNWGLWMYTGPFFTPLLNDSAENQTRVSPQFQIDDNFGKPSAIAVSGDTNHVVYVGTDSGRVYRIFRANDPCHPAYRFDEITPSNKWWIRPAYITSIAVDPNNPNVVLVTRSSYDNGGIIIDGDDFYFPTRVMATNNAQDTSGTVNWFSQRLGEDNAAATRLPICPVYTATFNPKPNLAAGEWYAMIGTEFGIFTASDLYFSTDNLSQPAGTDVWTEQNGGDLKRVPVYDLFVRRYRYEQSAQSDTINGQPVVYTQRRVKLLDVAEVYAATAGRGVMKLNVVVGLDENDALAALQNESLLSLYPNPTQHTANLRVEAPGSARLEVQVLNLSGQVMMTLPAQTVPAGEAVSFSTAELPNGLYLVRSTVELAGQRTVRTQKLAVQH
jgi:hypothetical protein